MRALLPVITTRRPDRRDRGYLAWVALAAEVAHLPLETAPIDSSTHVLEIYVDGFDEPLVVLAEPLGAPDPERGFPLRLAPLDKDHADALRRELFGAADAPDPDAGAHAPSSRGSLAPGPASHPSEAPEPLTMRHAAALSRTLGEADPLTSSRRAPGSLRGRLLAEGRFVLEELLGGGASGEVYRGLHHALRRPVAVKVLHPSLQHSQDYCARFYAEALAASQLDHRNVLRILDYGQEPDGILYIVMELLEGRNLQQILDDEGPLPIARLVNVVSQACAGLGRAHEAGVVHRDIKPENVVVVRGKDDDGNEGDLVKVCDFGIAHWVPEETKTELSDDDATLVRLPDARKVVGTPAYMAPEQIRSESVDARADVYALGILLYELSTGRLPFISLRPMEVLMMHVTERPTPPSQLMKGFDPRLERIILKALEKDPDRRHADVRVLRAELRGLVEAHPRRTELRNPVDERAARAADASRVTTDELASAAELATNTAVALKKVATAQGRARTASVHAVSETLHAAVSEGNVKLACELLGWLHKRSSDPGLRLDERDELDRALRVLRDPAPARSLAAHLLGGKVTRLDDAFPLLAAAGPVGARSLLDARRQQAPSLEVRARFVAFLRATGPTALPVILGGLEPLTSLATRSDEALADDLLRAAPDVRDDAAGELAVRFVRGDKPSIAVVALTATVNFWGPRAHALILGVLDTTIDPMRIAAIEALQRLRTVDAWAIERLGRILNGHSPASLELRVVAAETLALTPRDDRPRVVVFLRQRLKPPSHWLVGSLMAKAFGAREDGRLIVALARSLAALDPLGAAATLREAATSYPELRAELEAILAG